MARRAATKPASETIAAAPTSGEVVEINPGYVTQDVSHWSQSHAYAWDVETVSTARTEHLLGTSFRLSSALITHMRKDAAIYAAITNRVAPFRGLSTQFLAPKRDGSWTDHARGQAERIREEMAGTFDLESGRSLSTGLVAEVIEQVALAGFCVTRNVAAVRDDGSRIDLRPEVWPLDCVQWSTHAGLEAVTTEGVQPIVHGDGRWTVYALHDAHPWVWGAVVPLSLCWIDRAFGIRDRRNQSQANGSGKPIGVLPEGVKTNSAEGRAAIAVLKLLHRPLSGGVFPHGMSVEWLESVSQAWQIYREIIRGNDSDIPRIMLGQDSTSKTEGGNYVKDGLLIGVRNDIVEGDLAAVQRGLYWGTFRPWAALNFGSTELASRLEWSIPDPDEDQRAASLAARMTAYVADIVALKTAGFAVDPEFAAQHARRYGVEVPPLDVARQTARPAVASAPELAPGDSDAAESERAPASEDRGG